MYHYEVNPKRRKMSRKFFFCFPLRLGNIVFGYIVIICALALFLYNVYEGYITATEAVLREKFRYLEPYGQATYIIAVLTYYAAYSVIALLMLVFAGFFTMGVYRLNFRHIKAFFVYSFIHIFFTIGLMGWEVQNRDWLIFGILAVSDVLLIASLFGVKYMMDAVKSGRVYHNPRDIF